MRNALFRWKEAHGLTYQQAAHILGIKHSQAKKIGAGLVSVSVRMAQQIEKRSNGGISAEDLVFPDRFQNGKRKRGAA